MIRPSEKQNRKNSRDRKNVVLIVTEDWTLDAEAVRCFLKTDPCRCVIQFFRTEQGKGLKRIVNLYLRENNISTARGDHVIYWGSVLNQDGGDAIDCDKRK